MKITDSITINTPVEKVFETFTSLDKATERVEGITNIEILDGPAIMQVGTKWRETRVMFGKEATEVMWVTELTLNQSYTVEASSHGAKYITTYTFTSNGDSTDVQFSFEGTPLNTSARIMSIVSKLFIGATKKALRKDLEDLKRAAEQKS